MTCKNCFNISVDNSWLFSLITGNLFCLEVPQPHITPNLPLLMQGNTPGTDCSINHLLLEHVYCARPGDCGNLVEMWWKYDTVLTMDRCHRLQSTAVFYLTVRDTLLQPLMFFKSCCQRTIRNIFQGSPKYFFCYSHNISLFWF